MGLLPKHGNEDVCQIWITNEVLISFWFGYIQVWIDLLFEPQTIFGVQCSVLFFSVDLNIFLVEMFLFF